jgi:fucose 4-O-acetylase-like acetyltransferase
VLIAQAQDDRSERRLQVAAAAVGSGLIALGLYAASMPTIYRSSSFWTSSPTYFTVRVGVLMLFLAAIYAVSAVADRARISPGPLEKMGRSSLFVYWIHVELVYGYAAWPIRHRLPLWQAATAYAIFCALIYGAVLGRDRLVDRWRARRAAGPSAAGPDASPQTA